MIITSLTYGAPAAHSLGFKNGGLNDIINKLNKLTSSHNQGSSSSNKEQALAYRDRFHASNIDNQNNNQQNSQQNSQISSLSSSASTSFIGGVFADVKGNMTKKVWYT